MAGDARGRLALHFGGQKEVVEALTPLHEAACGSTWLAEKGGDTCGRR